MDVFFSLLFFFCRRYVFILFFLSLPLIESAWINDARSPAGCCYSCQSRSIGRCQFLFFYFFSRFSLTSSYSIYTSTLETQSIHGSLDNYVFVQIKIKLQIVEKEKQNCTANRLRKYNTFFLSCCSCNFSALC